MAARYERRFRGCANPNLDARVVNFNAAQPGETLFITDVALAEITYGIEQLGDAARRTTFVCGWSEICGHCLPAALLPLRKTRLFDGKACC